MRTLSLLLIWGVFLLSSQAQSGCPNNKISNGDAELGTPTLSHEDIANATGFSPIWNGSNWAEFYPSNFSPVGAIPSPATGNYVSCWIASSASQGNRFREGFQGSLAQPIAANAGSFDFSMDIACLHGWGTAEIAVYGVYNPNQSLAPSRPTGAFTPSNMNLFGPNNTVLLGTIPIDLVNFDHNKTNQTITFNTSNFPANGITHFFITNSDNDAGGIVYTAFDNFCIAPAAATPPCNLVNGDAELGTPTLSHEDIANATGFSPIWNGSNWAEFYPSNFSPVGAIPSPATGNYVSCWIASSSSQGNRFREGFQGSLAQPIAANAGSFDFSMDIACLHGWGTAEIAIYGVYNPNQALAPSRPTGAFTPSNMNLFGPNNTVLLGTIPIDLVNFDHNKTNQTITFNTSNFPANGITHFFITNSDNDAGGIVYTAFDNFCIAPAATPPPCNLVNGDAELGTPTLSHEDIANATGFSPIWNGSNWAEFYPSNFSPVGAIPSPATGNYVSCWIASSASQGNRFREGFQGSLAQPIAANAGSFDFSMDIACLHGWGTAEIAIYGVYNPNQSLAPSRPTGAFTPSNMNLFGPNNTVLLGTIPIDLVNFDHNKTNQTITFNTSNFPANGITHFFITNSDNNAGGIVYTAFDNFCIAPAATPPPCNLVNGDAELGTPTLSHEDIANATGFSPIWNGSNWAEFYPSNFSPVGAIPSPATGNYVSCWIASSSSQGNRFREGFQGSLAQPIAANAGSFDFSMDIACLHGWGTAEIAIYGVYNPNQALAPSRPTGAFTPSNINLFGPNNTVLLGTIPIDLVNFDHNKTNQTITFNTSNFPANGITHFFITNSDNDAGGIVYTAFDNFCITPAVDPCPEIEISSISCVPEIDNSYEVVFTAAGNGEVLSFSSNCGSISPSTITLNGQQSYLLTIVSNNTCSNFQLSYTSQLASGQSCQQQSLDLILPDCRPACLCDDNFAAAVLQGFSYTAACPNDQFAPVAALSPCDEVDWYINGKHLAGSMGNNSVALPHQNKDAQVCMIVTRVDDAGRICQQRYCETVSPARYCLTPSSPVSNLQAFPNPVQEQLQLKWEPTGSKQLLRIAVYNANGIVVKERRGIAVEDGVTQLEMSALPAGLYWIQLQGEGYQSAPLKIIKQ